MKIQKMIFSAVLLVAATFFFVACGNSGDAKTTVETAGETATKAVSETGPEYTSAFICPMHCPGSGSATAGKCPTCGMDYVANEKFKGKSHDGHDHSGHDHSGHDHGSHEGHNH